MSAAATVFFLVALVSGDSPVLAGLSSYPDLASCQAAQAAINEQLSNGMPTAQIVCFSSEELQALAGKAQ